MKEQILSLSLLILVSLTTMMLWKFFSAVVQILNTYCSQHFLFCRSLDSRGFLGFFLGCSYKNDQSEENI